MKKNIYMAPEVIDEENRKILNLEKANIFSVVLITLRASFLLNEEDIEKYEYNI